MPADARYACPMEIHPDETDPTHQGPYFSAEAGKCHWCGMTLKPLDELAWVKARRAAAGAEVAYTCPEHQHVFSKGGTGVSPVICPRCGRKLEPFKVMFTCPDPQHAGQISVQPGSCPKCGRKLVSYRGVWLSPEMADRNVPPNPALAENAAYRCPTHPLAHSSQPGKCTICAADLAPSGGAAAATSAPAEPAIPADAKFVCPMEECWRFSAEPGACPKCAMKLKPIEDVEWAQAARAQAESALAGAAYVCPMHPAETADAPGTCPVCGMQLVAASALPQPTSAPAAIAAQVNYLMEHYLALQKHFASDSTKEVALHALGLVGAADEILRHADVREARLPPQFFEAVRALRAAALKTNGKDLDADRVTFVDLGAAITRVIEQVRPSREKFPTLYLFHCPMTKGDWIQTSKEMANPFYGFAMLKCGEPVEIK